VATIGDNPDHEQWAKFKIEPEHWRDGIFIAQHGVSFDAAGNLFVQAALRWSVTYVLNNLCHLCSEIGPPGEGERAPVLARLARDGAHGKVGALRP
jgi:hypothetical protein